MTEIGIIDAERLTNIPKKHHPEHEFCFHLHDLMTQLLVEMNAIKASDVSFPLESEEEARLLNESGDVLDFLAQSGRGDIERRVVINHVSMALFSDMLHFIYEALIALEKRKFSVAFALMRKPFKEGLVLAAWMCADEVDFFDNLKTNPRDSFSHGAHSPDEMTQRLKAAIKKCRGMDFANAERIYSLVYDRKNEIGLAPLFDKATHLVTKNKHIATEDYDINFIFKNPLDNDVYESHYSDLAMLLLFLHVLQIELYSRMNFAKEKYLSWLLFTSLGTYESLFTSGRARMVGLVNNTFKEFLVCQHCEQPIRLRKADAPRFFVAEILECKECGMAHHFPLNWLLSKLTVDIA